MINFNYFNLKNKLEEIDNIKFTGREIDVISCIIALRGTCKIATLLNTSNKTIETHISNIMRKIGIHSRENIIDFAQKSGKFNLIKQYYTELIINYEFKNLLKGIIFKNNIQNNYLLYNSNTDK